MSCLIKNIDEFCKNFSSVSFNSGSFNNTTVEVQVLGAKDEPSLDGDIFSLKNNFGDVLPFLEEEFKVVKAKSSKSESGVITSYSLQDNASIVASSFMVGLAGRIGGDVMIGNEYYSVQGVPDPEGIGIPQDLLFSRSRLLSVYNRIKDGSYYINTSGGLSSNPKHWKNDTVNGDTGGMIGSVPDPSLEHGQILYNTGELFSVSPLPLPVQELQGVSGLYSDTGSFFDVMNAILSRYSKIFVANPFLGGFYVHSLGNDFGKKEVLRDAGVIVPDSSISSSLEKDYLSGYSSGAFIRKWSNGTNPKNEPDSETGGNAHTVTHDFYESDADETDAVFELQDGLLRWSQKADLADVSNYTYRLPSSPAAQGLAFAVEKMHNAGLAQEYELVRGAFREDFGCARITDEQEKINALSRFSEFKDEEGNVNPDGYEVYKNAGDLVEWVESWGTDPDEINSPGPWRNCWLNHRQLSGKDRVAPEVLEFFLQNEQRWQIKTRWGSKEITRTGDVYGMMTLGIPNTFAFEVLGTSQDPCGSKNWWTDEESEVSFVSVESKLKDTPFSFFSNIAIEYDTMTVKEFFFGTGDAIRGKASLPLLSSYFPDESKHLQGIILTDRGPRTISHEDESNEIINMYGNRPKSYYSSYNFSHLPEDYKQDILVIPMMQAGPMVYNIFDSLADQGQKLFQDAGYDMTGSTGFDKNDTLRYYGKGNKTSPVFRLKEMQGKGFPGQKHWVAGDLTVSGSEVNPVHVQRVLRSNSLTGDAGCIHPNRNLQTFSAELTTKFVDGSNSYSRYYGTDGKINLNAYHLFSNQGPACVESLDRIEFTLVGELIDFSHNDWINTKKYLESMNINVSNGTLTASYIFSQKVMLPDYLGISAARASRMNLIM